MKSIEQADSIEELLVALWRQAEQCDQDGFDLGAGWGDERTGRPWFVAAAELRKAATNIERRLKAKPRRNPAPKVAKVARVAKAARAPLRGAAFVAKMRAAKAAKAKAAKAPKVNPARRRRRRVK